MKTKTLLTTFFLFYSVITFSQSLNVGDIVKFSADIPITAGPTGFYSTTNLTDKANFLKKGAKYRIMELTATTALLMSEPYSVPTAVEKAKNTGKIYNSDYYNNKIYTITRANFDSFAAEIETNDILSVGLLTLPFKARPQDGVTFDTEFNFNATLNIRLGGLYGASFNYQIGAGIGSVGLNTSNASGLTSDEAQDVAILTGLNGFMVQYKRVQIGLYAGVDFINNQKNYNWESNGNIWFGFGVGYSVFDVSLGAQKSNTGN